MPLQSLDSQVTVEKIRYVGQVPAWRVRDALWAQSFLNEGQRRNIFNMIYNMTHSDRAEEYEIQEIYCDDEPVPDFTEINIPSKGVSGKLGIIQFIHHTVGMYLVTIDEEPYLIPGGTPVRVWRDQEGTDVETKVEVNWPSTAEALSKARDAVGKFEESVNAAEKLAELERRPMVFVQHVWSPEHLSASQIYRTTQNVMRRAASDDRDRYTRTIERIDALRRAGVSDISSGHKARWIVDNIDELRGRTIQVRMSRSIHPANMPNVKGVVTDAWVTSRYTVSFVIDGQICADEADADVLLYEPEFCRATESRIHESHPRRCAGLRHHIGGHTWADSKL